MARRKPDPDQQVLPFSAQLNERLAEIRSLESWLSAQGWHPDRAQGVIELLERIVLCSTDGETSRARVSALAARIQSRRAVSERTVRRWARDAEELGLLVTERLSQQWGGHRPNFWRISRVKLIELITPPNFGMTRGGHGADTMSAPRADTVTAPRADAMSAPVVVRKKVDQTSSVQRWGGNRPEKEGDLGSSDRTTRDSRDPPDQDRLRNELVTDHWLLRDAHQRRVAKMPPGELVGNVFAVFDGKRDDCLSNGSLVIWFRRALGVRDPLVCDTEADLLLVLAAGLWAAGIAPTDVKKTRRHAFGATVSRRIWGRCVRKVPAARELLDRLLAAHPQALEHPEGLGPRAEQVTEVTS